MGFDTGQSSQQEKSVFCASKLGKFPCWREFQEVNRVALMWQLGRRGGGARKEVEAEWTSSSDGGQQFPELWSMWLLELTSC